MSTLAAQAQPLVLKFSGENRPGVTLLVTMDEPRMPDSFFVLVNVSRTLINSQPLISQWNDAWDARFETSVGRFIQSRQWCCVNSSQVKRRLCYFI